MLSYLFMLLNLYATGCCDAIELLIEGPRDPLSIQRAIPLLVEAAHRGDCIAPFFLDHLKRTAETQKFMHDIETPNLDEIPSHLAGGATWIDAIKIYLSIQKESLKRNKNTHLIIELEANLERLAPLGLMLMGRLHERNNKIQESLDCYRRAAYYPSLLGIKYYARLSQQFRIAFCHTDGSLQEHNLMMRLAPLYKQGPKAIYKAHPEDTPQDDGRTLWYQWSCIHGYESPWHLLSQYYLNPRYNWSDRPLSEDAKVLEAQKWFHLWKKGKTRLNKEDTRNIYILIPNIKTHPFFTANKQFLKLVNNILCDIMQDPIVRNVGMHPDKPLYDDLLDLLDVAANHLYHALSASERLNYSNPITLNEWGNLANEQKEYRLAEQFFRAALKLHPDYQIAQRNLANTLIIQNSYHKEVSLLLKVLHDQNDPFILSFLIQCALKEDFLTSEQLEIIWAARKAERRTIVDGTGLISASSDDINGTITRWLPIMIEWKKRQEAAQLLKKSLQKKFDNWKLSIRTDLEKAPNIMQKEMENALEQAHQKRILLSFQEALDFKRTLWKNFMRLLATDIIQAHEKLFEENDPRLSLSDSTDAPELEAASSAEIRVMRARETLQALQSLPSRSLTLGHIIQARKAFHIILGNQMTVAPKEGSRVRIDGVPFHSTHGIDRPSPGACHAYKKHIKEILTVLDQ